MTGDQSSAAAPIAGVELGGTKCICVLSTPAGGIVEQTSIPTTTPDETLAAIEAQLDAWWRKRGFSALGIASFGPLRLDTDAPDYGSITATTKPGWSGVDIARRLSAPFAVPIAFDTDVNGAAFAEYRWGAAKGLSDFAYVTVGTGVGVGLIVNGAPTRGFGHCELGHILVRRMPGDDWPGVCGFHDGCVEGLASGTAIKERLGSEHVSAIGPDHAVWDGVVDTLAQLCHTLVLTSCPRRILIGGGVAAAQPHLLSRIDKQLRTLLDGYATLPEYDDAAQSYVRAPGLGAEAGPLGPVAMALSELAQPA